MCVCVGGGGGWGARACVCVCVRACMCVILFSLPAVLLKPILATGTVHGSSMLCATVELPNCPYASSQAGGTSASDFCYPATSSLLILFC